MQSVKIADLKNNLSRHLARVRHGDEITVIDRDTPVARIVPFMHGHAPAAAKKGEREASAARIADLARKGVVAAGDLADVSEWLDEHEPIRLPKGSPSAVKVLLEMRRESTR
jgi:prevent-host-death family protein